MPDANGFRLSKQNHSTGDESFDQKVIFGDLEYVFIKKNIIQTLKDFSDNLNNLLVCTFLVFGSNEYFFLCYLLQVQKVKRI